MISILNPEHKTKILQRLSNLTPNNPAQWGSLTADKMIPHLNDQMSVALSDVETKDVSNFFFRRVMKSLVLFWGLPTPKGKVKTDPTMLLSSPSTWKDDIQQCSTLIDRVINEQSTPKHPIFGPLSHKEWCILVAIHIDHHLKQFGC